VYVLASLHPSQACASGLGQFGRQIAAMAV
jgi:hypothetical protein